MELPNRGVRKKVTQVSITNVLKNVKCSENFTRVGSSSSKGQKVQSEGMYGHCFLSERTEVQFYHLSQGQEKIPTT